MSGISTNIINILGGAGIAEVKGNIDYALIKNNFNADDAVGINLTAVQDYYVVGLANYLSDTTVPDVEAGWGLFAHGQAAAPTFLVGLVGPVLPVEVPSFQAKLMRMVAVDSTGVVCDAYLRFDKAIRVQHYVPATWTTFNRRCNIFFVTAGPLSLISIALGRTVNLIVQMYG
jgi:hypothetical protein